MSTNFGLLTTNLEPLKVSNYPCLPHRASWIQFGRPALTTECSTRGATNGLIGKAVKGRRGCATVCGFSLGPVSHISRSETGNSRRIPRVRTPARVRGALVCAEQKRAPVALPYFSITPRLRQQTLPGHDIVRGFFMALTMYIYGPADSNSNYPYQ